MIAKLLVAALIVLAFAMPAAPVHAGGGTVTVCDEAHLAAALASGGTVTFACSGIIRLTTGIVISQDTTIDGAGQEVTISGGDAVRVFTVTPGASLNLNRLTVANGNAHEGGGLYIPNCFLGCGDTVLTFSNSVFSANSASSGSALFINSTCVENCGQLTIAIENSRFSDNRTNAAWGGVIATDGGFESEFFTLTINNSTFSSNVGGAIYSGNYTDLSVSHSTFNDNVGDAILTALYGFSRINVSHSDFIGNTGNGIRTVEWSNVNVDHSVFSGNGRCGIDNWDSTLTVSHSAFTGNTQCGIRNGDDGGIATVTNSTFSNNGGEASDISNGSQGTLTLGNSTLANISGSLSGGIANGWEGNLTVSNSTLDGVPVINWYDGALTLKNTIVANSQSGSNCTGVVIDGGGNLSYPDTTCPGISADPLLGPLQDNGGATLTMMPDPGSPAINTGVNATCAAPPVHNIDQRGVIRPVGPACDIGAVEVTDQPSLPWRRWLPAIMARS